MISLKNLVLIAVVIRLLTIAPGSLAQHNITQKPSAVPVYRSAQDSIALANIDQLLTLAYQQPHPRLDYIDSLEQTRVAVASEGIIKMHQLYYPDDEKTPVDSLPLLKDLTKVHSISINNKDLRKFPALIRQCINLEHLEIVNCRISRLPHRLKHLKKLKTVSILNNKGQKSLVFSKNKVISSLIIHGENQKSHPRRFAKVPNLKYLDLSACELNSFPKGIAKNRDLEELILQHNFIRLENDILPTLQSLKRLALQHNDIRKIPASIVNFPSLNRLNCNHNEIVEIDAALSKLQQLEFLSLYNNQLTTVPKGVYALRSLKIIDLYFNKIDVLTDEIANWKNLEILFVSHNHLFSLPDTISTMKTLMELYAYDNRLTHLPKDLHRLTALKVLRVNLNLLKDLPPMISSMRSLEEIDLSDNYFTTLPPAIFDYPNLKIVTVVNNPFDKATYALLNAKFEAFKTKEIYLQFSGSDR